MLLILALISLVLIALSTGVYVYKQAKVDVFRPVVIAGVTLLVIYVFDILYAVWDSTVHLQFELSDRFFVYDEDNLTLVVFLLATSVGGWVLGDILGGRIVEGRSRTSVARGKVKVDRMGIWLAGLTALTLLTGALFLLFQHIQGLGGLSFYWTNIGNRILFFADATILYGFIQLAIMLGAISAAFMVLRSGRHSKRDILSVTFLVGVVLLGLVFVLGLLTGARVHVVEALFVLAYIRHTFVRRYESLLKIAIVLTFVAVLSVFYVYETRHVTEEIASSPLDRMFNTSEVSQGNNLFIIANEELGGFAQGETLLSGSVSFLPRAVLNLWDIEKEKGGNDLFTSLVWPERLAGSHSEMALGILGEVYLNFGLAVVPILAIFLGFVYKAAYEMLARARTSRGFWLVLNGGVAWSGFQLLRSDLFHTASSFAIFAAACVLFYASLFLGNSLSVIARDSVQRPALAKTEMRHR